MKKDLSKNIRDISIFCICKIIGLKREFCMEKVYILSACRTVTGNSGGSLKDFSAVGRLPDNRK
jgi:hypothetical protein